MKDSENPLHLEDSPQLAAGSFKPHPGLTRIIFKLIHVIEVQALSLLEIYHRSGLNV